MSTTTPGTAKKLMTADEFWEFCNRPENANLRLELIRGEVVECPMPYHKHGVVCATVGAFLCEYADRVQTGYVVGANAGVILALEPQSVVGPDVAYFRITDTIATGWSESHPVLAIEVLAPNEDLVVVRIKVEEYLRHGVANVWLIDYEKKAVSVYQPGQKVIVFDAASTIFGEGELTGFSLQVGDLFRLPAERVKSAS